MILQFPRFLLAGSSKGSIQEPGDGQLVVPATVVPTGVVGTPIDETATSATTAQLEQSFFGGNGIQLQGVNAAQDFPMQRFGKGLWHIKGRHIFQFSGTAQPNALSSIGLTDKSGNTPPISFISQIALFGTNMVIDIDVWLMLREDGTRFRITTPAIIAGDSIHSRFLFMANKIW